ncbi:hypothetical protein [Burkholderia sp. Ac-20344]|uniref:hypothetical protein n=1 Tax=Burkholderia sp. Ac-20344 TaxID=2703890 RepID=UPI001F11BB0A|nr:hypothetical protein [Burkholderia sp. Ac-20344]
MSHSIDLTAADIAACVGTGTAIVHNPSAIMSFIGRCAVPELIDAGVTVVGERGLMEGPRVLSVDESEVLERVNEVAEITIERSGLRHLLDEPKTLWGRSRYKARPAPVPCVPRRR